MASLLQLAFFVKYHVAEVIPLHLVHHSTYEYRIDCTPSFLYESCSRGDEKDSFLSYVRCGIPCEFESHCTTYFFYQKNLLSWRCLNSYYECECTASNSHHSRRNCYGYILFFSYTRTSSDSNYMARYRLSRGHDTGRRIIHSTL